MFFTHMDPLSTNSFSRRRSVHFADEDWSGDVVDRGPHSDLWFDTSDHCPGKALTGPSTHWIDNLPAWSKDLAAPLQCSPSPTKWHILHSKRFIGPLKGPSFLGNQTQWVDKPLQSAYPTHYQPSDGWHFDNSSLHSGPLSQYTGSTVNDNALKYKENSVNVTGRPLHWSEPRRGGWVRVLQYKLSSEPPASTSVVSSSGPMQKPNCGAVPYKAVADSSMSLSEPKENLNSSCGLSLGPNEVGKNNSSVQNWSPNPDANNSFASNQVGNTSFTKQWLELTPITSTCPKPKLIPSRRQVLYPNVIAEQAKLLQPSVSKMESAPGTRFKGNMADFATPKIANRRTRITGGTGSEKIPTAHVSPLSGIIRPASGMTFTQQLNEESNLRRAASTDMSRLQGVPSDKLQDIHSLTPSKQWSSMQNVSVPHDDFRDMTIDTDPTLDQTHWNHLQDAKINDYRHRLQSHPQDNVNTGRVSPYNSTYSSISTPSTVIESRNHGHTMPNPTSYASVPPHTYRTPKVVSTSNLHPDRHVYNHEAHAAYSQLSNSPRISPRTMFPDTEPSHITGSSYSPANSEGYNDITSWQQKHRDQLKRQHHDVLQTLGSGSGSAAVHAFLDPHKADSVREAADSIIKEKDAIIDRLRLQLQERQTREMRSTNDTQQGRAALHRLNYDNDFNYYKMQDLHLDSQPVRPHWMDGIATSNLDAGTLERQLGEREYELHEIKATMDAEKRQRVAELKLLQEKLHSKENDIEGWKMRYSEMKTAHDMLQKRLEAFDRYVADLPTVEQSAEKIKELKMLKEAQEKSKTRIAELEKKVLSAKKTIKGHQELTETAKNTNDELQRKCENLQAENAQLKKQLGLLEDDAGKPENDIELLKSENAKYKQQYEQARKLLESKHRKLGSLENKHRKSMQEIQERLSQEEAMASGLRQELLTKDAQLKKLKASAKELSREKQLLMERNLALIDQVKEYEEKQTGEQAKLEQQLLGELMTCYTDLQCLVQLCIERAQGQEPNISILLGVNGGGSTPTLEDINSDDTLQSLKYKLSQVKNLRKDIDILRGIISDKYAEDMGENLNCTTQ